MQNINITYNKFSPLFLAPHKEWFNSSILLHKALNELITSGINDNIDFSSEEVRYIIQSDFNNPYFYIILYNLSKIFKVKIMWMNYIERDNIEKINKGFKVFGNINTVTLFYIIVTKFFNKVKRHKQWYILNEKRLPGYKNIIGQYHIVANNFYEDIIGMTSGLIFLEDHTFNYRLENWIMGVEKLNYKNYKGKTLYQHATSKKYHHKRMLL